MHERNVLMQNTMFAQICSKCITYFAWKNYPGQLPESNCLGQLFGGQLSTGNYLGDNYPGTNCPVGAFAGSNYLVGNYLRAIILGVNVWGAIFLGAIAEGAIIWGKIIQVAIVQGVFIWGSIVLEPLWIPLLFNYFCSTFTLRFWDCIEGFLCFCICRGNVL